MITKLIKKVANLNTDKSSHQKEESTEITKPTKILLEWDSLDRMPNTIPAPALKKIAIIFVFIGLIFFIIKDFLMVGSLAAIYFAMYVFSSMPPGKIKHKITTNGICFADDTVFTWKTLRNFYMEARGDTNILMVNTKNAFPGRLFMILDNKTDKNEVIKVLNEYLSIIENPKPSFIDKFMDLISKKIKL